MIGYPLAPLRREVAFLALHLHWPQQELLDMDHRDRREWVRQTLGLIALSTNRPG